MRQCGEMSSGTPSEFLSHNALERRVKRWLLKAPFECYLQVTPGLEELLIAEIGALGLHAPGSEPIPGSGGVTLALDAAGIMRANLELRTASRVLLRLGSFPASSPEMLYDRARGVPWVTQLGFSSRYALHVTSRRSKLPAGDGVANTVASAVSRELRPLGLYPKPDPTAPLTFHVHLADDRCTISLDTSGEHLHRRGRRQHVHTAPVRETLAAAMALVGVRRLGGPPDVVLDPFCGSGTLLMETVDLLRSLPPGRDRTFALEQAAWFRPGTWREVRRRADERVQATRARVIGVDVDRSALAAARANLDREEYASVELVHGDNSTYDVRALGARRGLLIANLPYGVRLAGKRAAATAITDLLERLMGSGGWEAVLLTTDPAIVLPYLDDAAVLETRNGGLRVALVSGRVRSS